MMEQAPAGRTVGTFVGPKDGQIVCTVCGHGIGYHDEDGCHCLSCDCQRMGPPLRHHARHHALDHTTCGLLLDARRRVWSYHADLVTCPRCIAFMTQHDEPATLPIGSVGPEDAAALVDPSPDPRSTTVSDLPNFPDRDRQPEGAGVVAHFYLSTVTYNAYDKDAAQVTLQVVGRGEQNKTWAAATPAGQLTLTIKNPSAARQFTAPGDLGAEYEVTIRRLPGNTP